ncbi:MAG TPA: hypothetical protein VGA53_00180 [Candidatus Paceibacterota bacterium]
MYKYSFYFFVIFLVFSPVFSAQSQTQITTIEFGDHGELTPAQDCQIERISGRLLHRLGCIVFYPYLFIGYFVISGIVGSLLLLGGIFAARKFGKPQKYRKLFLAILFLLPFILFLFL